MRRFHLEEVSSRGGFIVRRFHREERESWLVVILVCLLSCKTLLVWSPATYL